MNTLLIWIWKNNKTIKNWFLWIAATSLIAGLASATLLSKSNSDKDLFLPGKTTNGHYQIEQECDICHEAFSGNLQKSCLRCHKDELNEANDSHKPGKFRDPRNFEYLEKIDALNCVTCHREHKPGMTRKTGVTIAADFCIHCHEDIGKARKSHKDLKFDGCSDCHNYHDNRALYEDFLVKHNNEPALLASMQLPERNFGLMFREKYIDRTPLDRSHMNAPAHTRSPDNLLSEWESTAHAKSGINCKDCHQINEQADWVNKPAFNICKKCHKKEMRGFVAGRHGMRLDHENLSPMQPDMARLPMKKDVSDKQLSCNTCHTAHRFDTQKAAVDACLDCHDDNHSKAYKDSPHYQLLITNKNNQPGHKKGVSCSNCHLPRLSYRRAGKTQTYVQHNQNNNLRPRHKMIREVCLQCHGLGFTLDALADETLINNNFSTSPGVHLKSIKMAESNIKKPRNELQERTK